VLPFSVRVVSLVPVQTEVLPEIVPQTDAGLIVTVTGSLDVDTHVVPLHEITTWPLP
jgi:hypothetical protein